MSNVEPKLAFFKATSPDSPDAAYLIRALAADMIASCAIGPDADLDRITTRLRARPTVSGEVRR